MHALIITKCGNEKVTNVLGPTGGGTQVFVSGYHSPTQTVRNEHANQQTHVRIPT